MLGITHQMIALVAALWVLTIYPQSLGVGLGIGAVIAVMIGALTPDLDHPTAQLWKKMIGARVLRRVFQALFGGHRHFTHSLAGIVAIGWLTHWLVTFLIDPAHVPAALVLWQAFMIGYISHPIADTFTDMGVPWLWPLKWPVRIPPGGQAVRVTTGSWVELVLLRGGVIVVGILLLSQHSETLLGLFR